MVGSHGKRVEDGPQRVYLSVSRGKPFDRLERKLHGRAYLERDGRLYLHLADTISDLIRDRLTGHGPRNLYRGAPTYPTGNDSSTDLIRARDFSQCALNHEQVAFGNLLLLFP